MVVVFEPDPVTIAVNTMGPSTVPSLTVKVTLPVLSEVPLAAEIVALLLPLANVTVLPDTATPEPSLTITVIVEVDALSASTEVGLAVTVERLGLAELTCKVAEPEVADPPYRVVKVTEGLT